MAELRLFLLVAAVTGRHEEVGEGAPKAITLPNPYLMKGMVREHWLNGRSSNPYSPDVREFLPSCSLL